MSGELRVVITFEVLEDKLEMFGGVMTSMKTDLPQAEGCNGLVIHKDRANPFVFVLVEDWDSEELHDAHIAKVVAAGGWDVLLTMLKGEPVTRNMSVF